MTLLCWRFLIAFAAMSFCLLTGIARIHLKGKNLLPLFCIAVFQPTIYFIAETAGIGATTASESGSFLACIPVGTLLASSVILKKKPKKMQIIGTIGIVGGVYLANIK